MLVTCHDLPIDRRVITFVIEKVLEADMRKVAVETGDERVLRGLDSSSRVAIALSGSTLQRDRQQHNTKKKDTLPHSFIDTAHLP